jgi:adenylate cyclase
MQIEIERKFLVKKKYIKKVIKARFCQMEKITQAYLGKSPASRVRIYEPDNTAEITIKSPGKLTRQEFNFKISYKEALNVIKFIPNIIQKNRYYIYDENSRVWHVDEYLNPCKGLWVAEIELWSEDEEIILPHWIGEEISGVEKYKNSTIAFEGNKSHCT